MPGSGRSVREGTGDPLQYSWASLVAQLVENLPAVQETRVWKIPWRREWLPTPAFWPGEFHGVYSPWGHKESTWLSDFHFQILNIFKSKWLLRMGEKPPRAYIGHYWRLLDGCPSLIQFLPENREFIFISAFLTKKAFNVKSRSWNML